MKPHYKLKAIWPTAYYHLVDKRAIICVTPRAASTSMMTVLEHKPRVTQEDAIKMQDHTDVVLWLRDPLERWASAADLFMRNKGWDLSQFAERTLEEDNVHWMPQIKLHSTAAGILVPNKIYPFEFLNDTWSEHCDDPLPRINVTKSRKKWDKLMLGLSDDELGDILDYYDEDFMYRGQL